ncbi:MAG: RecX family transcriptional regulator [Phycisphaeraceae bacterium]|nr:RecX family transcriptional regulator [Phycisphaeraceae bacterium]
MTLRIELQPLARDPNMVRIRVDARDIGRLRAVVAQDLGIRDGSRWTAALQRRLEETLHRERIRTRALGMLARTPLFSGRLRERLARLGHDAALVDAVLRDLAADGWIDDRSTAEDAARGLARRGTGTADAIARRLVRSGADEQTARAAAAEAIGHGDDLQRALALAKSRLPRLGAAPAAARRRRLASWLARRGFDEDTVHRVVSDVTGAPEDDAV